RLSLLLRSKRKRRNTDNNKVSFRHPEVVRPGQFANCSLDKHHKTFHLFSLGSSELELSYL
ncbi:hypothetical protein N9F31_03625, partial [Pseudomonadales bacterium]|nr:hypothetical protein [Pseudomonadales bacterium]